MDGLSGGGGGVVVGILKLRASEGLKTSSRKIIFLKKRTESLAHCLMNPCRLGPFLLCPCSQRAHLQGLRRDRKLLQRKRVCAYKCLTLQKRV